MTALPSESAAVPLASLCHDPRSLARTLGLWFAIEPDAARGWSTDLDVVATLAAHGLVSRDPDRVMPRTDVEGWLSEALDAAVGAPVSWEPQTTVREALASKPEAFEPLCAALGMTARRVSPEWWLLVLVGVPCIIVVGGSLRQVALAMNGQSTWSLPLILAVAAAVFVGLLLVGRTTWIRRALPAWTMVAALDEVHVREVRARGKALDPATARAMVHRAAAWTEGAEGDEA